MVFTFLKARGVNVGNSLVEDDQVSAVLGVLSICPCAIAISVFFRPWDLSSYLPLNLLNSLSLTHTISLSQTLFLTHSLSLSLSHTHSLS